MKSIYTYALLGALLAVGGATAATTTTTPVGYETIALTPSSFNLVGLRLQGATLSSGSFTTVAGKTLTKAGIGTGLVAGRTYVLEIISATAALNGVIQEVTSFTTDTVTTPVDLQATFGLTTTDTFKLRLAPTLEEIFGTTTLGKGVTSGAATADIIWIPNGTGGYDKYFQSSLTGTPFKSAATNLSTPNTPVVYADGLLIEKKAVAASLTVTGEVKTKETVVPILKGFNVLSTVYPAGSTLQNAGLNVGTGVTSGAATADIVWVPTGTGTYTKYFKSSLTGTPWKNAATNVTVAADVPLTSGILIERKGVATNFTLTPPTAYSSL